MSVAYRRTLFGSTNFSGCPNTAASTSSFGYGGVSRPGRSTCSVLLRSDHPEAYVASKAGVLFVRRFLTSRLVSSLGCKYCTANLYFIFGWAVVTSARISHNSCNRFIIFCHRLRLGRPTAHGYSYCVLSSFSCPSSVTCRVRTIVRYQ